MRRLRSAVAGIVAAILVLASLVMCSGLAETFIYNNF